jgi:hypothetical protein
VILDVNVNVSDCVSGWTSRMPKSQMPDTKEIPSLAKFKRITTEVRGQNVGNTEKATLPAPLRSLGEWRQIEIAKESRLLFGVDPSDHESLFVIMEGD